MPFGRQVGPPTAQAQAERKIPFVVSLSNQECPSTGSGRTDINLEVRRSAKVTLFGSSGIRGIVDKEFLKLVFEVGLTVGSSYRPVVVGSDTRTSSSALKHTFISALLSAGSRAYDAGTIPTPTLAYAARKFEAGAMITASHNPPQYNGIKLWNPDGSAFDSTQRGHIEEMIGNRNLGLASWEAMGASRTYPEAIEEHVERIMQDFSSGLKLKVVLDCGCGAASLITPHLLRRMGCEVLALNCDPSGYFPRGIEPTPENLAMLVQVVKATGADLGIAHDGDGDRMMAVDDAGRFVPGDKLLILFAREFEAEQVVTTVDASMAIEESGFEVIRTRVGDTFVSEELKRGGDFAGEPSGSWIFPSVSYCPDGIYAAAQIARIAYEKRLSKLVDDLPSYPILRGSVRGDAVIMARVEQRIMEMEPISVSTIDGLKLSFEDGWLLIRPSGTEPKIRLTAEASSQARAQRLYELGIEAIKECTKG